jgi:WD40 repeat protein/tetratricopeptide (TPR) repeat protein
MNQLPEPDRFFAYNEQSINTLARAINYSQGEFSLILVRCNYASLRRRMMTQLQQKCSVEIRELELPPTSETLYTSISGAIGEEKPQALAVFGLERLEAIDAVLASTNQVREEFRKSFAFPLVLWINDDILRKLIKQVPDLESWASVIEFEIPPDDLKFFLQETADTIFEEFLNVGAAPFLNKHSRELGNDPQLSGELRLAQQEIQHNGIKLSPELAASLEFLIGLATTSLMQELRCRYEQSLELWPADVQPERRGCVAYQLGLWWRTYAVQHRSEYGTSCEKAASYYQQAIDIFEAANRSDLVAKFINPLAEVLQRLQQWEMLEAIAQKSLALNETLNDLYRQASASSYVAEAAIGNLAWDKAKQFAGQALQLLDTAISNEPDQVSNGRRDYIDWQTTFRRGWYLFALGRAQWQLEDCQVAIDTLELARITTRPEYDPPLFIQILHTLRRYYFEQREYLKAFDIRLEYRSLEQQYGFRAFVGAGRLQAQREVINPALVTVQSQPRNKVSQEIEASGRQKSVDRLIERISRADQKLIVLHGQSGVGKSSIIQAGLIPSLDPITLDTREVITILQQVYTNWTEHLGREMLKALEKLDLPSLPESVKSPQIILERLRESVGTKNSMVVLIFDQFEEFFFAHKEPSERKTFYAFLKQCLDIPYVKVVLSLREDYLHYLLECNDRLIDLNVINNNILDKGILFYLGNFSQKDAKSVFSSLTKNTPYPLSFELTEELVQDLSEELGEIRPIELQVVGAQLQTEQITTLESYREKGPKDRLVSRFLDEVTQDCGPENEDIARLVLYLLTDENNTRPLKTREDIELEINVSDRLDLILTILVRSGLVFRIPSSPSDRYQLVHDYLVIFVRQGQSTKLIAELEKEREQRQLTEKQLNEALQKQLRTARRATFTLTGLVTAVTSIALLAVTAFINTSLVGQTSSSAQEEEMQRVISALRVGKFRKGLPGIIQEVHLNSLSEINQANNSGHILSEIHQHTDEITDVAISKDGSYLASSSKDTTVFVWKADGTDMLSLPHPTEVNCVEFSPDGTQIATGSSDGHIRLWDLDGNLINKFEGRHDEGVALITFSPDGEKIISGGADALIKVWDVAGNETNSLEGHNSVVSGMKFSGDGKTLATFAEFDPVIVWNTETWEDLYSFEEYAALDVDFNVDQSTIEIANQRANQYTYELSNLNKLIGGFHINSYYTPPRLSAVNMLDSVDQTIFINRLDPETIRTDNLKEHFNLSFSHDDEVTSFAVNEEKGILVSADKTDTVTIWDISLLLSQSKGEINNGNRRSDPILLHPVSDTVITSDGQELTKIFNYGQTTTPINTADLQGDLLASNNETGILVVNNEKSTLKTWNSNNNDIKITSSDNLFSGQNSHLADVSPGSRVVISDDGRVIVTADKDGFIQLLKSSGEEIFNVKAHDNVVNDLSVSQDKKVILSTDGFSVKVWNSGGSLVNDIPALQAGGEILNVEFSPNSDFFITHTWKGVVKLWSSDGRLVKNLDGHVDPISLVKLSPDGETILTVSYSSPYGRDSIGIRVWTSDGSLKYKDDAFDGNTSADFSPDGKEIYFYGYAGNTVKRISTNGQLIGQLKGHLSGVIQVAYIPISGSILTSSEDGTLRLWDERGELIRTYRGHDSFITSFSLSSDFKTMASIDAEGMIKIWDLSQAQPIREVDDYAVEFSRSSGKFGGIYFSPDGSSIVVQQEENFFDSNSSFVTPQDDGHIRILDLLGEKRTELNYGQFLNLNKSMTSYGPEVLIFVARNDSLGMWTTDGKLVKNIGRQYAQINGAAISPNDQRIAVASNKNSVLIWDNNSDAFLTPIKHEKSVNSVAFSWDGGFLATASDDESIRIFDAGGQPVMDNDENPVILKEHTDLVTSVLFSPDRRTLASASKDGTIRMWDTRTWRQDGKEIQISGTSSDELDSLWFSEDGNILAYGTNPTHVQLLGRRFGSGTWIKQLNFYPVTEIPERIFGRKHDWISVEGNKGKMLLSLGLDHSLEKACRRVISHLRVVGDEGEKELCGEILESP